MMRPRRRSYNPHGRTRLQTAKYLERAEQLRDTVVEV